MKKTFLLYSFIIILIISCQKDKNSKPIDNNSSSGYKIEIIKGGTQADTLGNLLKDSIIVKITKDENLLKNVYVRFETSGCDNNTIADIPMYAYKKGIAAFQWRLNGTVGQQSLKITLLDSLKSKKDSIVATATGIMPTTGWHRSSCTPDPVPIVNSFCKLSSGRLIATFNSNDYPYYSDDNAITWHVVKTFPVILYSSIVKLIAIAADEIFAATQNNGLYYSKDGGQTWEARSSGITDPRYFTAMNFTNSGKLIYTTDIGGVYLSTNKGLSWKSVMNGLPFSERFYYPSEQINGDLYMVSSLGTLYKSTNNGGQWNSVSLSFTANVQSIFINDNGDFFLGASNSTAELYRSVDGGATWAKIYTAAPIPGVYREIETMSKQDNGTYYFYTFGNGIVKTSNFADFTNIAPPYTEQSRCYITTKTGQLVIGTALNGIYYNLP